MDAEKKRLEESRQGRRPWKKWGPYLSERQWGTVREDYSPHGNAWEYFSHDAARSRAYRWGEDGIGGLSDDRQQLCLALALWNGKDPILKERFFGLTGNEGNHGEDVKEYYYFLDSTPTHSYMKMLYKYPQSEYPYSRLVEENRRRGLAGSEFELIDTGVFDEDRYFDVFIEYAKAAPDDILMRVTAVNRGPEPARLSLIPQIWFRNTWSWTENAPRPLLKQSAPGVIEIRHPQLGNSFLHSQGDARLLFCENETNSPKLFGSPATGTFFKDGIHQAVVEGRNEAVNPELVGTKAAAHFSLELDAGASAEVRLRLNPTASAKPFADFEEVFGQRIREADQFYEALQSRIQDSDARNVQRQALAGMLWSKQYYLFDVDTWLKGDPAQPAPPPERLKGRNHQWLHLHNADIISMPDTWEYPWYAAWDLAFHCIALVMVDPEFAKNQLVLLTGERYMHPNGQMPAYEWAFGDVNPPVHAWALWRVYKIDQKMNGGKGDRAFLERVFHKLLLNFTWWVNRKDEDDHGIFQGGFLGLDNIGIFDRSAELPTGGHIEQSDGTSWMAMFSLNLMRIALELAEDNAVYQDLATKFFEHFLLIAGAMTNVAGEGISLWDEEDEFFYDVLHCCGDRYSPLKVRSMVGLVPLLAVETIEPDTLDRFPEFKRRLEWFLENRPELAGLVSRWHEPGLGERRLLSLLRGHRMKCLLRRMLDESEFLSDYGVRAVSRHHLEHPFEFHYDGQTFGVRYQPGESDSGLFGGNSNWRGPIWFPLNFLIVEAMQKFHHYYGDDFKIECPTGSGRFVTILEAANEVSRRLTRIFLRDDQGKRAVFGNNPKFQQNPHFRDHLLFHEYFHGDEGCGLGASHQTGWTGLVAKLLQPRSDAPGGPEDSLIIGKPQEVGTPR